MHLLESIAIVSEVSTMSEQLILIAYDIQCHNARSAALRQLRKVSISYQDSVFELHLTIPKLQQLLHNLQALINPNDSLLTVQLHPIACWQLGCGIQSVQGQLLVIR
ncbi:hypothetical protein CEQ32_14605 [Shewanella sp. FDAARGOS_354]|nr:hypothetical protein CEQ32_14605 [Shewanella sp. FDAARGOS_354]